MEYGLIRKYRERICRMKKGIWRTEKPEGYRVRKYKLGPDGEYTHDFDYPGENPEESEDEGDLDNSFENLIDSSLELSSEEKENLKRDIADAKRDKRVKKIVDGDAVVTRAEVDFLDLVDDLANSPEEADRMRAEVIAARQAKQASEKIEMSSGEFRVFVTPPASRV